MSIQGLSYTEEHEWVKRDGQIATVGITQHAVDELGEIVFVDLPKIGDKIEKTAEFGTVESVKTLSSLYMPVSGEVIEINSTLGANPAILNDSPYEEGWLIKIKIADENEFDDLLSYDAYKAHLENL